MRLLKRDDTGCISFTKDLPESELPSYPYAILSHTWGPDHEEVNYDDVKNGIGTSKPGLGSEKIRFCVRQTRRDHLDYFWVDTCCIDKRNDPELSSSLRSMFRWYARAQKCYVYLSDVPKAENLDVEWQEDFQCSRWFKRGWTLQELIAPSTLEFYSKHGKYLGTKTSLERAVNDITHIPARAIRGDNLSDFSIHERRQWQEGRETRVPEDLVYSLLGLLDVSMPVLYGEGIDKAWQRLDNEVIAAQKGERHMDFSLTFSLAEAPIETQHFVARQNEVEEIHNNLSGDGSRKVVVLHGLGGIGKTQLAISYAKRHRSNYSALFWLNAKDGESAKLSYVKFARLLLREHSVQLPGLEVDQKPEKVIEAVKAWLSAPKNTRWLMVCDNYDNPRVPGNTDSEAMDLRPFLPEAYQGSVIVTTRSSEVKFGYCMSIAKMDLDSSLKILENSSRRGDLSHDLDAIELAKRLDGLPLALATAGAYLSQTPAMTFRKYISHLENSWAKLQKLSPQLITYEDGTLYSTWQVSFDQVERRNEHSANLLRLWAYFDNQDIWFELLSGCPCSKLPPWFQALIQDELEFYACVQVLCGHGLVQADDAVAAKFESQGYSMHPCVHSWAQTVLNGSWNQALARIALYCVASHAFGLSESSRSLSQPRLLHHVRYLSRRCKEFDSDIGTINGISSLGMLYYQGGDYKEAEKMILQAIQMCHKTLSEDCTVTLSNKSNLVLIRKSQSLQKYVEESALEITGTEEAVFGKERLNTLFGEHELAATYTEQDRLEEVKVSAFKHLEVGRKRFGEEHPLVLPVARSLACLCSKRGYWVEAEALYKELMETTKRVYGEAHQQTLQVMASLAHSYSRQHRWKESEILYAKVLEARREKTLGEEHPDTATAMCGLAKTYFRQGRLKEAKMLDTDALELRRRLLGETHPHTLDSMYTIAIRHLDSKEAEDILKRLWLTMVRTHGDQDMRTLVCMTDLVLAFIAQEKWGEVLTLVKIMVKIQIRSQGASEPFIEKAIDLLVGIRSRLSKETGHGGNRAREYHLAPET